MPSMPKTMLTCEQILECGYIIYYLMFVIAWCSMWDVDIEWESQKKSKYQKNYNIHYKISEYSPVPVKMDFTTKSLIICL